MRTMLLITLMLAMPAAAAAQDAGDADQADQRANEGASDYEAAWTVDPAAELDEETRRRRGEALERAALEFVGVTEPPSRTEQASREAVSEGTECAMEAAENAVHALIWGDGAKRWAARTAWDCRRGGEDLLGGLLGGLFGR